jgi:hypothetical protein
MTPLEKLGCAHPVAQRRRAMRSGEETLRGCVGRHERLRKPHEGEALSTPDLTPRSGKEAVNIEGRRN